MTTHVPLARFAARFARRSRSPRTLIPSIACAATVLTAFATFGCGHTTEAQPARTASASLTSATQPAPAERYAAPLYKPATIEPNATGVDSTAGVENWAKRYPDAAKGLNDWMQTYPEAATELSSWDASNPVQMKALVDWAVTHRYAGYGSFLYERTGWDGFTSVLQRHPQAMDELLDWVRRSPYAAEELSTHADAFTWARGHLRSPAGHLPAAPKSIAAGSNDTTSSNDPQWTGGADRSFWYPKPGSLVQ